MNRSSAITTIRNRLLFVAGASALVAAVLAGPAASAPAVPPDDTYEISGAPSVVRPGGTITFTGTCWMNRYLGATTHVNVRGALIGIEGVGQPFGFKISGVVVDPRDGSYSGRLAVPGDAPQGNYTLGGQCITQDQVPGDGQDTFTVEGDPLPTTSTTTAPVTSTTLGGTGPGPGTTPPPAVPVPGPATFTG